MCSLSNATPPLLFAAEYLRAFPARGRAMRFAHLGLTFYGLTECQAMGHPYQVLLPLEPDNAISYIFKESCPYLGNEGALHGHALAALGSEAAQNPVMLDEAAPFYPPGAENFWHWLTESLPKLLALERFGYSGPYIVPADNRVVAESLDLLGIPPSRRLPAGPLYRVKRLILPPRLSGFELIGRLPLCEFLRQNLLEAAGELPGARRLYIKRIGSRRVLNEQELLTVLADFGFEVMAPEDFSLAGQFRQMSNVVCSVMAHGANSALSLFQRPGGTFIELFGNRYVSYNNLHAVRLLKLRYHPVVQDLDLTCAPLEEATVREYLADGLKADMMVDVDHVRILLESALG